MIFQNIDYSKIKAVVYKGKTINKIVINNTRKWEKITSVGLVDVWVESGRYEGGSLTSTDTWKQVMWNSLWLYFGDNYTSLYHIWYDGLDMDYYGKDSEVLELNGEAYVINNGIIYQRGQRFISSSPQYYTYEIRKAIVQETWIDTSHFEQKSGIVTTYFY